MKYHKQLFFLYCSTLHTVILGTLLNHTNSTVCDPGVVALFYRWMSYKQAPWEVHLSPSLSLPVDGGFTQQHVCKKCWCSTDRVKSYKKSNSFTYYTEGNGFSSTLISDYTNPCSHCKILVKRKTKLIIMIINISHYTLCDLFPSSQTIERSNVK